MLTIYIGGMSSQPLVDTLPWWLSTCSRLVRYTRIRLASLPGLFRLSPGRWGQQCLRRRIKWHWGVTDPIGPHLWSKFWALSANGSQEPLYTLTACATCGLTRHPDITLNHHVTVTSRPESAVQEHMPASVVLSQFDALVEKNGICRLEALSQTYSPSWRPTEWAPKSICIRD
jgi:hypothetical protein